MLLNQIRRSTRTDLKQEIDLKYRTDRTARRGSRNDDQKHTQVNITVNREGHCVAKHLIFELSVLHILESARQRTFFSRGSPRNLKIFLSQQIWRVAASEVLLISMSSLFRHNRRLIFSF